MDHGRGKTAPSQERLERAHRILDAAAELLQRWGYNKSNIDDIAKQAGVGKGTIYLHWRTREDLFAALVCREQVELAKDFERRIADGPENARLGTIIKHTVLALMKRPLLKALAVGDINIWGKLLEREQGNAAFVKKIEGFKWYLEFLQERHLIRQDLSLTEQLNILAAVTMGFFVVAPVAPEEYRLSDEEMGDLIAKAISGALEPNRPISTDELSEVWEAFMEYAARVSAALGERLQVELGG